MISTTFYLKYQAMMETRTGIPPTLDEVRAEVDAQILKVAGKLSRRMAFGYHEPEDMIQYAYIESVKLLSKERGIVYDFVRPLDNFLFINARNRLKNIKRSQCFRDESPCKCCKRYAPPEDPCPRFVKWKETQTLRQRIFSPTSLKSEVHASSPGSPIDSEFRFREMDEEILRWLPGDLVEDYEDLKADRPLTPEKLERLIPVLRECLEGTAYDPAEEDFY